MFTRGLFRLSQMSATTVVNSHLLSLGFRGPEETLLLSNHFWQEKLFPVPFQRKALSFSKQLVPAIFCLCGAKLDPAWREVQKGHYGHLAGVCDLIATPVQARTSVGNLLLNVSELIEAS